MGFKRVCLRAECLLGPLIVTDVCMQLLIQPPFVCRHGSLTCANPASSLLRHPVIKFARQASDMHPLCAHPCLLLSTKKYLHLCSLQHVFQICASCAPHPLLGGISLSVCLFERLFTSALQAESRASVSAHHVSSAVSGSLPARPQGCWTKAANRVCQCLAGPFACCLGRRKQVMHMGGDNSASTATTADNIHRAAEPARLNAQVLFTSEPSVILAISVLELPHSSLCQESALQLLHIHVLPILEP